MSNFGVEPRRRIRFTEMNLLITFNNYNNLIVMLKSCVPSCINICRPNVRNRIKIGHIYCLKMCTASKHMFFIIKTFLYSYSGLIVKIVKLKLFCIVTVG